MDIDFHFGTIYVLARWAGFGSNKAKIIATSSQLVDDNVSDKVPGFKFDDIPQRFSGHELWQNLSEKSNVEVWVPFHFLPGLCGEDLSQKAVCYKDSPLASALADSMIHYEGENQMFRLGVALHVYADTWAHQQFSGVTNKGNTIVDLEIISPTVSNLENLKEMVSNIAMDIKPLGHASALHYPDLPYLAWKSMQKFTEGRKNWEEFIEASKKIYTILCKIQGNEANDLSNNQEEFLLRTFNEIQGTDCEKRNNEWIKRIQMNYFDFDELTPEDQSIAYSQGFILGDADYPELFYRAVDEHYQWVQEKLRDAEIEMDDLQKLMLTSLLNE
ncbi:MAG: DUF6765 family protein [Proteocatella sp.]